MQLTRHNLKMPAAIQFAEGLQQAIDQLIAMYPPFAQHLTGLSRIDVYDEAPWPDKDHQAQYNRQSYYIRLSSAACDHLVERGIVILLHEIGHHVMEMRHGISLDYNYRSPNQAYYFEEVRAQRYMLQMAKRLMNGAASKFWFWQADGLAREVNRETWLANHWQNLFHTKRRKEAEERRRRLALQRMSWSHTGRFVSHGCTTAGQWYYTVASCNTSPGIASFRYMMMA